MMRVLRVEESDDDAGVDDDQRHSERSLLRYPRPYSPVRHPAKRSLAVVALVRRMRPVPSASTRILSPAASPARCKTATGRVVWFLELMHVTAGVRRGVSIFFREPFTDGMKSKGTRRGSGRQVQPQRLAIVDRLVGWGDGADRASMMPTSPSPSLAIALASVPMYQEGCSVFAILRRVVEEAGAQNSGRLLL
jgi:hypothetical protein